MTGRRLLLVHAHPDDESLMTGGTIAHYLAQGAQVMVVTCTLGEEGEVIGDTWAQLVADGGADQLGGYRILELTRALAALGPDAHGDVLTPRFLGGAGRWRDSGMAGSPSARNPRAFVNAPLAEPVEALAEIIGEFRPQVVVGYDPAGSYGHPDHRRVHDICARAIDVAATTPEDRWRVDKHYYAVTEATALAKGLASVDELHPQWRMPADGELPSYPDAQVTTEIDISEVYDRKVAALRAHATQVTVAATDDDRRPTSYVLSNNIVQPIFDREHFILVRPEPVAGVREDDLFAGLDL